MDRGLEVTPSESTHVSTYQRLAGATRAVHVARTSAFNPTQFRGLPLGDGIDAREIGHGRYTAAARATKCARGRGPPRVSGGPRGVGRTRCDRGERNERPGTRTKDRVDAPRSRRCIRAISSTRVPPRYAYASRAYVRDARARESRANGLRPRARSTARDSRDERARSRDDDKRTDPAPSATRC